MSDRSPLRRIRHPLLWLCVLLAFLPLGTDLQRRLSRPVEPYPPVDYRERFAGLRSHLPPRGVIGYLYDPAEFAGLAGQVDPVLAARVQVAASEMFLTWQALAPRIVTIVSADLDLVVSNNPNAASVPRLPERDVVVDLGNGVVLWKRREQQGK